MKIFCDPSLYVSKLLNLSVRTIALEPLVIEIFRLLIVVCSVYYVAEVCILTSWEKIVDVLGTFIKTLYYHINLSDSDIVKP